MKLLNDLIISYELYTNNYDTLITDFTRADIVSERGMSKDLYYNNLNNILKIRLLITNKQLEEAGEFLNSITLPANQKSLILKALNYYINNPNIEYKNETGIVLCNHENDKIPVHITSDNTTSINNYLEQINENIIQFDNDFKSKFDEIKNNLKSHIDEVKNLSDFEIDTGDLETIVKDEMKKIHDSIKIEIKDKISGPAYQITEKLEEFITSLSSFSTSIKSYSSVNETVYEKAKESLSELNTAYLPTLKKSIHDLIKSEYTGLILAASNINKKAIKGWKIFAIATLLTLTISATLTAYLTSKFLISKVNIVNIVKPDDFKKLNK